MRLVFLLGAMIFGLIATVCGQSASTDSIAIKRTYVDLGRALADNPNVYRLKLNKKKLKTLPPEIFELRNLEYLSVANNKLKEIPPEIGKLTKLKELNISGNKLNRLPGQIGNLKELKTLNLNKNVLEVLPHEIGELINMTELLLWSNELDDLPDEIANCTSLKTLELRGILFNAEQHDRFFKLLPVTEILLSPPCNCK